MPVYNQWKFGSSALPSAPGTVITWSFATANYGDPVFDLFGPDLKTFKAEIVNAFAMWSKVAKVDFKLVSDSANVDIRLGFGFLDGGGEVLARATTTTTARPGYDRVDHATIVFDESEIFLNNSGIPRFPITEGHSIISVAAHEIGHVLGLNHSDSVAALMNSAYNTSYAGPMSDDISGARNLYGARTLAITGAVLYDGRGHGTLTGTSANDLINGFAGNDALTGGAGNDTLIGGAGTDGLDGGTGADSMIGGDGNDYFRVDIAQDRVLAGKGKDTVQIWYDPTLATPITTYELPADVENIEWSMFATIPAKGAPNYTFIGNSAPNVIKGATPSQATGAGGGHDFLSGLGGNDTLWGQNGNDTVYGGTGNDELRGWDESDHLYGGEGNDLLIAGHDNGGADVLYGGPGNDSLYGDSVDDVLNGGPGDDTIQGGIYNILNGGPGMDFVNYTFYDNLRSAVKIDLADPHHGLVSYESIEGIIGTKLGDTLVGDAGDNYLRGRLAGDILEGGAGSDFADYLGSDVGLTVDLSVPGSNTGEAAGDSYISIENLRGSRFNDKLYGDDGVNILHGGTGNDSLNGRGGADIIRGEGGNDMLNWDAADQLLNGGDGTDTLKISSGHLNLTNVVNTIIVGIENVDMRGGGSNKLSLNQADLLDISATSNTLKVMGDAGDSVNIIGAFTALGDVGSFRKYKVGAAILLVDSDITSVA
jgi:Ca2+-binding RTX toxin-like protein